MISDQEKRGILGIENRTENWKTAHTFARMYPENIASLANHLLSSHCGSPDSNLPNLQPSQIRLELFWKGIRDYVHQLKESRYKSEAFIVKKEKLTKREKSKLAVEVETHLQESFTTLYNCCFGHLRDKVSNFNQCQPKNRKFANLKCANYNLAPEGANRKLFDNLLNTEIDIVIDTPNHLFIGEAKGEMGLGADGSLMLVHQLIRQYVAARILLAHLNSHKTIIPFIVWDKDYRKGSEVQVEFMMHQGWLDDRNILSWGKAEMLAVAHRLK